MNSYWNREADSEFTLDLLCFSQIDFRFNICFKNLLFFAMSLGILNLFGNWLWIHFSIKHFYGKFIRIESIFSSRIRYKYTICSAISLLFSNRNSLSEFMIRFAHWLWIRYRFREFIMNPLFTSWSNLIMVKNHMTG